MKNILFLLLLSNLYSNENYFKVNKHNGKIFNWGIINSKGKIVLPIQYAGIGEVKENILLAKLNDKWGLIKLNGDWIIKPKFIDVLVVEDDIFWGTETCSEWVFNTCERGKWQLYSTTGKLLNENQFNGISSIEKDTKPHLFGKINGEHLTDRISFTKKFAIVYNQESTFPPIKNYGAIDRTGTLFLNTEYSNIKLLPMDWLIVHKKTNSGIKLGLYDSDLNLKIECKYRSIEYLGNLKDVNYFLVEDLENKTKLIKKVITISNSNTEVFDKIKIHQIKNIINEYFWSRETNTSLWGVLDKNLEWFQKPKYKSIRILNSDLSYAESENRKSGYLFDKNFTILTEIDLEKFNLSDWNLELGILYNKLTKKYFIINKKGESILEKEFDSIQNYQIDSFRITNKNYKGFINKNLDILFKEGLNYQYIDDEEKIWYTQAEVDTLDGRTKDFWGYYFKDKHFFMHSEEGGIFSEGHSWISLKGRNKNNNHIIYQVIINEEGKEISELKYLYTLPFANGFAVGQVYGGAWGYLNKQGKIIWWSK
jgi:hypothetical protein